MALIKNNVRKSSDEMIVELLGNTPDKLSFVMLSNDNSVQNKFKYDDDRNRTDEVEAKSVTLHIAGIGSEIEVKVLNPGFTLKDNGLGELQYCQPDNLAVAFINDTYYWRADSIKPVKRPE
jgi:hypothetical protein